MRERPDLTYPLLPDAADLDSPRHPLPVDHTRAATGSSNVPGGDDFEWPEAGPSRLPAAEGPVSSGDVPQARLGPYGAKMVAAMTGATTTSLLSKSWTPSPFASRNAVLITRSDTVRRAEDTATDRPASPEDSLDTTTARRLVLPDIVADVRVIIVVIVIGSSGRKQSFDVHHSGAELLLHRSRTGTRDSWITVCSSIGLLVPPASNSARRATNGVCVPVEMGRNMGRSRHTRRGNRAWYRRVWQLRWRSGWWWIRDGDACSPAGRCMGSQDGRVLGGGGCDSQRRRYQGTVERCRHNSVSPECSLGRRTRLIRVGLCRSRRRRFT